MRQVRYTGNAITLYCAGMLAVFALLPIAAIPFILSSEVSTATIVLSLFCLICSFVCVVYIIVGAVVV